MSGGVQSDGEDLIAAIGRGDRRCFEVFYDRFCGVIYTTALRVLNSPMEAEDVTQEVFFTIWEKAPMYDVARGKPATWAMTMARNKAIDRLRSLQRRIRLRDALEEDGAIEDLRAQREPSEDLDYSERGEELRKAVEKLSEEQREAIELAFFKGLSQQEVADRLGTPLGTVKARIRRGMLRLKKLVGA